MTFFMVRGSSGVLSPLEREMYSFTYVHVSSAGRSCISRLIYLYNPQQSHDDKKEETPVPRSFGVELPPSATGGAFQVFIDSVESIVLLIMQGTHDGTNTHRDTPLLSHPEHPGTEEELHAKDVVDRVCANNVAIYS